VPITKICARPGCCNTFSASPSTASRVRHCSPRCGQLNRVRKGPNTRTCAAEGCDNRFECYPSASKIFCSRVCGQAWRLRTVESRTCAHQGCDNSFTVARGSAQTFCSLSCGAKRARYLEKTCEYSRCGNTIRISQMSKRRFCDRRCAILHRHAMSRTLKTCEATGCTNTFIRPSWSKRKFCDTRCGAREQHKRERTLDQCRKRRPVGSRRPNNSGYVEIKTETGWKLEHRWIVEGIIGRELLPNETAHHKNTIRNDNRPENLELWYGPGAQPSGGRVSDLVDYVAKYHAQAVVDAIASLESEQSHE
jgi:hypothetical protein